MSRLAVIVTLLLAGIAAVAAPPADRVYDDYAAGADAAARADWIAALGRLSSASRALDSCTVDDTDFALLWWPAKKSLGEVAARLGLHTVAEAAASQMAAALAARPDSSAHVRARIADLCKLQGSAAAAAGSYPRADSLLRRSLELKPYDPDFVYHTLHELASVAYATRDYRAALRWLDSIAPCAGRRLPEGEAAAIRGEVDGSRAMVLARLGRYAEATALADSLLSASTVDTRPEHTRRLAKILSLEADATGRPAPRAAALYRDYLRMARRRLDTTLPRLDAAAREQYWMAELPYITDSYRLGAEAPDLIYDMALYAKGMLLRAGRPSMRLTHRDIRRALGRGAAAIEYVSYERGGRARLAAVVQRRDRKQPVFVELPAPDSIAAHRLAAADATVADALAVSRDRDLINALYTDTALRAMIWPPQLTAALDGVTDVYFAPDGLLHRLAAEYLAPEGLRLHRLSSTRLLCERHSRRPPRGAMLLAGGVDYTAPTTTPQSATNDPLAYSLMAATGMGLAPLPGSQAEVDSVARLRAEPADVVLHADSVSEAAVRSLAPAASMILISTHGYFADAADTATDLRPAAADTQLSQSCIFLAGAERNMRDAAFDPTRPDGILSARELAGIDLSGVELAVLSACMSGLGYVTPDGVFGLQRGLKAAGAGAIVTSLWEVDDRATSLLMRYLFEGIAGGMTVREAFDAARIRLRDTVLELHYPGFTRRLRFDSPYFHDAFILTDAL